MRSIPRPPGRAARMVNHSHGKAANSPLGEPLHGRSVPNPLFRMPHTTPFRTRRVRLRIQGDPLARIAGARAHDGRFGPSHHRRTDHSDRRAIQNILRRTISAPATWEGHRDWRKME